MEMVQLRMLKREVVRARSADPNVMSARDRIVLVATDVLRRHNFQEFALEPVAKSAHVTRRTLYNHFASKQELYQFIRTESLRRLMTKRSVDIPERMDLSDGVRFFVEHVHEIVGDHDNIDTLHAIVRDGASQPWLRNDYIRLVRDPMVLTLENFILRHLRRRSETSRNSRRVCEQLILAVESLFVHPLIADQDAPDTSHDISLGIIATAFSSMIQSDAEQAGAMRGDSSTVA